MQSQQRAKLVRRLQLAYSGELGAAIAYRRHAASLSRLDHKQRILQIRREELEHRACVGRMLLGLGGRPDPLLELRNRVVGAAIGAFCMVGGWFWPMYGAGWIERRNIAEYELAARLASLAGAPNYVDDLLTMAEVEWEHERFFRLNAATHWLARIVPIWSPPGPKQALRQHFADFQTSTAERRDGASAASPLRLSALMRDR